jgi:hypothetical protein
MMTMQLKHWRMIGAAAALFVVAGCYAHGAVGRTAWGGSHFVHTAEANGR